MNDDERAWMSERFDRIETLIDKTDTKVDELSRIQATQFGEIHGIMHRVGVMESIIVEERSKRESDRLRVARIEEREKERSKTSALAGTGAGVGVVGLVELVRAIWEGTHK